MNQITTQYVTEGGACYEQYVITDPAAKTALTITPERGGMITGFTLDGDEYIWTRRPNFSECNRPRFGVPVLFPSCGNPDGGVHLFDGKAYPMECHGFADLCAWEVESVGPDGVTLILESTPLTKFLYPFDFTLLVNYDLNGTTASISMTVINEGDVPMPFSFGYHPYFTASALENVDFDIKCATCSENAKGEQPAAPEKITLTRKEGADNTIRLMTGVEFPMTFTDKGNGHKVTVDADESFTNGVLWQQDAESFVCMEPWNGWANTRCWSPMRPSRASGPLPSGRSDGWFSFARQKRTRKAPLFRGAGTNQGLLALDKPKVEQNPPKSGGVPFGTNAFPISGDF